MCTTYHVTQTSVNIVSSRYLPPPAPHSLSISICLSPLSLSLSPLAYLSTRFPSLSLACSLSPDSERRREEIRKTLKKTAGSCAQKKTIGVMAHLYENGQAHRERKKKTVEPSVPKQIMFPFRWSQQNSGQKKRRHSSLSLPRTQTQDTNTRQRTQTKNTHVR